MRTSNELNEAIRELDADFDGDAVPYFGWWWREVDWDADSVSLAASPASAPDWYTSHSFESMMGVAWPGRETRFCENNKWGYPEFPVEGEQWQELRAKVEAVVDDSTPENIVALKLFMTSITPAESDLEPAW